MLTPLHLEILLWYYTRGKDYEFEVHPIRIEYAGHLVADGILAESSGEQKYAITPRGRAWIEHILTLPWPIQKWQMPNA